MNNLTAVTGFTHELDGVTCADGQRDHIDIEHLRQASVSRPEGMDCDQARHYSPAHLGTHIVL